MTTQLSAKRTQGPVEKNFGCEKKPFSRKGQLPEYRSLTTKCHFYTMTFYCIYDSTKRVQLSLRLQRVPVIKRLTEPPPDSAYWHKRGISAFVGRSLRDEGIRVRAPSGEWEEVAGESLGASL